MCMLYIQLYANVYGDWWKRSIMGNIRKSRFPEKGWNAARCVRGGGTRRVIEIYVWLWAKGGERGWSRDIAFSISYYYYIDSRLALFMQYYYTYIIIGTKRYALISWVGKIEDKTFKFIMRFLSFGKKLSTFFEVKKFMLVTESNYLVFMRSFDCDSATTFVFDSGKTFFRQPCNKLILVFSSALSQNLSYRVFITMNF